MIPPYPRDVDLGYRFEGCVADSLVTKESMPALERFFGNMIEKAGFKVTGATSTIYPKNGAYSITVMIEESGIHLYCWPEHEQVAINIIYCNLERDNSDKATECYRLLYVFFQPSYVFEHPPRYNQFPTKQA